MKKVHGGKSCVFISSNEKITVCGCDGVDKYTEAEIVLSLTERKLKIVGKRLCLSTYVSGEIAVTGAIESISFTD